MDWSNALAVTFTGIVVVFIALILLVAIVSVFGMFTSKLTGGKKKSDAVKNAAPKAPAAPSAPVMNAVSGDDDEVAAIMGAIAAIMASEGNDGNYVVKSITPVAGKRVRKPMPAWAAAGVLDNTAPF